MEQELNHISLDTLCAAFACAMGIQPPKDAAPANEALCSYLKKAFGGEKADRLFLYNPDAIAQWIAEKYPDLLQEATEVTELSLPLCSVMPSVTPVCFATMYTGLQPEKHGIRAYRKPVLTVETLFDALIAAGKRVAIVSWEEASSISRIFLERDMDYYFFEELEAVNEKAAELIAQDAHDVIVVYHGNYDAVMHKHGPESAEALTELRHNAHSFRVFHDMIRERWQEHRTLMAFAMDHGCHEIDGACGSHGLDMPEDLNIVHYYKALPCK